MPQSPPQLPSDIFLWSEIARNFGILIAGVLGLGIAWWRSRAANLQAQAALEQTELARRGHTTEIFNRAVGQLLDEKLIIRLGAIYTLKAICQDDRYFAHTRPIIETLTANVRMRVTREGSELEPDVAAIVELLRNEASRRGAGE